MGLRCYPIDIRALDTGATIQGVNPLRHTVTAYFHGIVTATHLEARF